MHKPCKLVAVCTLGTGWSMVSNKKLTIFIYVSWNLVPGCIPSYAYMAESTVCMVYRNVTVTIPFFDSLFLCWESRCE